MADKSAANDIISVLTQKMELTTANDSNENSHDRLENNERTSRARNKTLMNSCSSERSNLHIDNDEQKIKLPAINLPEKILIVIDTVREENYTPFEFICGEKYKPLEMIKRVVEIFICAKGIINCKHEYALMILNANSAEFICDYTNSEKKLINVLNGIGETVLSDDKHTCDLSPCFMQISKQISCEIDVPNPAFVNRVILIYTRSNSCPILTTDVHYNRLMNLNYFFLDALFVHEPLNDDNDCEKVYSALNDLDIKQNSWIFEVGRNAAQLHTSMAKFLAHPLQRPKQDSIEYKVVPAETTEIQTNV